MSLDDNGDKCAGCDEPRPADAHAKGWRFVTCSDGDPRWMCGDCRKADADTWSVDLT